MGKVINIDLAHRKLESYHIGDIVSLKSTNRLGGSGGVVLNVISKYVVLVKWPSGLRQREFVSELIKRDYDGLQE